MWSPCLPDAFSYSPQAQLNPTGFPKSRKPPSFPAAQSQPHAKKPHQHPPLGLVFAKKPPGQKFSLGWGAAPVLRLRHNQWHQSDENQWVTARFLSNHAESNQALRRSAQKKKKEKSQLVAKIPLNELDFLSLLLLPFIHREKPRFVLAWRCLEIKSRFI